ncbi:DUF998 domain-containing protein [Herbiconiux daphne]|uniref:DUF998 domain-containing protein n=1 Tax=Herbiconiux daphne TaxID=2970914 RepID=A0ABT2H394_9MICO|nr:DUF998 domain-containing protein [Herbiconiux daphne]MCS5734392.1 DUF998 domain-containing protein [Herbiconiux daphne]
MSAARTAALAAAAVLAATGLALIWVARIAANRFVYVSELGAQGEPTAEVFRWALMLIAVSAGIVALCAPRLTPRVRWLAAVPPAIVLGGAAVAFGIASQVTCTATCPLPVGPAFTWQDLIHTTAAVLGFAGAAFAMLQVATDRRYRRLAHYSLVSAIAVAVISGAGGLLSVFQVFTQFGGVLEIVATTIALLWLVVLAAVLAVEVSRAAASVGESDGVAETETETDVATDQVPTGRADAAHSRRSPRIHASTPSARRTSISISDSSRSTH